MLAAGFRGRSGFDGWLKVDAACRDGRALVNQTALLVA